jgi:hypothetical protein
MVDVALPVVGLRAAGVADERLDAQRVILGRRVGADLADPHRVASAHGQNR